MRIPIAILYCMSLIVSTVTMRIPIAILYCICRKRKAERKRLSDKKYHSMKKRERTLD